VGRGIVAVKIDEGAAVDHRHTAMAPHIKQLRVDHYKSIKDIFEESFYERGMTSADLAYYWRNRSRGRSLGIFNKEGDLLGFALVQSKAATPGNMYLSYLAVHSSCRGTQLGSQLLSRIVLDSVRQGTCLHLCSLTDRKLRLWYSQHGLWVSKGTTYFNLHHYNTRLCAKWFDFLRFQLENPGEFRERGYSIRTSKRLT